MTKAKSYEPKPKIRKSKVEVRNPRYEGATPEMVVKALFRQAKNKPKG